MTIADAKKRLAARDYELASLRHFHFIYPTRSVWTCSARPLHRTRGGGVRAESRTRALALDNLVEKVEALP